MTDLFVFSSWTRRGGETQNIRSLSSREIKGSVITLSVSRSVSHLLSPGAENVKIGQELVDGVRELLFSTHWTLHPRESLELRHQEQRRTSGEDLSPWSSLLLLGSFS
jgi:hypothetical protein